MLPSWLTATGLAVAVLLVLSPLFLPMLLLPLWMLIVGIVFLVKPPTVSGHSRADD